jgi:hypothetical protein
VVADHSVTGLLARDPFPADRAGAGDSADMARLVVAYADKRAGQRLESMAARFASWDRRYPGGWDEAAAALTRSRAARLETEVCRAAGVLPDQVGRLRWTGRALRSARAAASSAGGAAAGIAR